MDEDTNLPLLGAISAFLLWMEKLIVLFSGPMLTAGLLIGLVSLLSDGQLLLTMPWLLYAWGISQAVGVDGQLVGAWYQVSVVFQDGSMSWGKKLLAVLALVALGLTLAYVAFVAALIFAMQQSYHLTVAQALAQLGMDSTSWLWQRAGISVFLVCLSGATRFRKKSRDTRTLAQKEQAIREQMQLEALQQQQRAQRMRGMIGAVRGAVSAATTDTPESKTAADTTEDAPMLQVITGDDAGEDDEEDDPAADETPMPKGRYNARRVNARLENTR